MTPYYEDESAVLHHGDALAVLRSLPSASVDALITDPPYSSGGMVRGDRTQGTGAKYVSTTNVGGQGTDFTGDNRDQRAYAYWCALWLSECLRIVKPGGIAALFTDWRQLPATTDALQAGGWVWRGLVPWFKPAHRPMLGRYSNACEYVVWGSAGPLGTGEGKPSIPGFYEASSPREREHQTQKPIEVMRHLIRLVPREGVVLDPFAGSGTTGVAALMDGRRFVGIEMTEHYVDVARRRLEVTTHGAEEGALQDTLFGGG
jgi:site-specific DNA-methyltransferase (adenine-specific)